MNSRMWGALGAAAVVLASAAPAAAVPYPPTAPALVQGVCVGDIPYFSYSVDFGENGKFVGRPMTITFVNPGGEDFVINTTVPAPGQTQQVLWPGASVSPQDWPGWVLDSSGNWVESSTDTGAFTRAPGGVTVKFATNPTLSTNVTYPPATSACANPKRAATSGSSIADTALTSTQDTAGKPMPETGANLGAAAAAGVALIAGAALVLAARRFRA